MFGGGGGVVYIAVIIIIIIIIVHPQTHLESTCRKSFHYLFSDHDYVHVGDVEAPN